MKNLLLILLSLTVSLFAVNQTNAQCNTNISICTPGQAGPFTFAPASPNPSSCLDYNNGQGAPNYAYIILYITQGGDLNLLIDGDQATGCLDVAIFDITGQADPCASLGLGTEIGCNYASACDGCNEFGSNFPCASEVPAPVVNTGDIIMILVEDWDPAQNSFTLELSNAPGSAQTGPPDPTITPQAVLCTTDAPVQMSAVNNGGTWSGTGVSPTGVFDPGSVAPGTYNITYDIGVAPCDASDMTTVTVIDCSAGLPCPDYANTATASNQACGGQLFDFEVANTACNGLLTFDVVGNYGSDWANEITWEVTSNLTGNVVASGGPGFNGGAINTVVNLDPAVEGTFFTMSIFDSFGDGFNGTGGFFQIEQGGNIISGPVTGNFGTGSSNIFGANVSISTSTLTINTPSGPVVSTVGNCLDHDVQFLLENVNYCTPINVNLPWSIVCDETGAVISSGTHAVTVYPQIPTASTDLIDISWNAGTCQWDVVGQNDCDVLDIGNIFTISPDPTAWPANTCAGGNQDFTVEYIGVAGGPDCCSTGGPLGPIVYNQVTNVNDAVVASSPFGGTNNSAYTTIGPNGTGGAATALTLDVDMSGYCFPDVPGTSTDEYWVTIIVDGNIVYDQMFGPPAPPNFNTTLNLGAIPGGYNENSTIEVYIYPNFFNTNPPGPIVNATYVPGVPCGTLGQGEWTASTIDVTLDVTFTEQAPTAANCTFVQSAAYTCCTTTPLTASNPATVNVQCPGDVPAADPLVVTDEAGPCNPVVSFLNDVSDGLSCPETITRTYQVTNDCGDVLNVQQLIVINDTQAPVLAAAPADASYQCPGDVPAMAGLGWTDNCDGTGTVAGSEVSDGLTCPETITRTWTYTDACGNTATETQTITVHDTQAPVFAAAPADASYQCPGDVPAMAGLGWTDNCDGTGTVAGLEVSDGLTCPETITRTWTYTDACGNTATETQTITVHDTQAPVFAAAPADASYQCSGDVPAMAGLGWTDNCDGTGTVAGSEVSDGLTCPETITRTWTYTDACGNTATETQTITVHDTQAPVFAAAPADASYQCSGDVPAMAGLGWTDNCDGAGTDAGTEVSDGLTCPETITRTWTYTDACGNTATETQTITVNDTQAPVFAAPPANVTVECSGDVPAMIDLGWTDNCDGAGTVTGNDVSDGLSCPETITRTWTYTDACGNVATVSQTIIIDDTTPPTASNPTPISVTGIGAVPPADPLVVNDEADNCTVNPVVAWVSDVSDNGNCPEIITRTYSVTDDCGNQILVTQLISVGDAVPPTASNPAPISVQCSGDVPAPDPLVVTDEADNGAPPVVTFESDASDGLSCPETITRTYRVTDDCGNFIFVTQTITVHDTQAPVFAAPPANVTVECIGDVPAMTNLGWTDNCDGTGNVAGNDVSDGLSCPETITRTWTYTDACGNTATETQTITVQDTQAPVFAAAPANATYECIGDVPAIAGLGWTDNCDGTGTAAGSEVSDGLACPETITRTWTYTDACGNTATETQTITVIDTQAPVFAAPPAALNVQCAGDVPAMINLGWTDNCDGAGNVAGNDVSDGLSCPETITRTWTYTDACGNTATETQIITVNDTQAPVFAAPPANVTVECAGDVPAMVNLGWTDNCDGAGNVAGNDVSDGLSCPETITRTWTYTDACGNVATVSQTIIVDDTTPPTASNPTGISITQGTPVPPADPLDVTDEADNCTVNPVVAWVSDVSDNGNCPEIITRTFSITDDCGNQSTVIQLITIGDPVPPTASNPAPINVQCSGDVPAPDPLVVTDEADNGAPPVVTFESDVSDGLSCPETITRTYRVTDDCGNFIFVTQTITIHDTQAPVLAAAPANATYECIGDVPAMAGLGWTDNCDGTGTVAGSEVSDGLSCPETITRTWTYTDACGNTATESQTITVHDTQAPVFAAAPANATYECIGDVPAMAGLAWTDNCDGTGTDAGTEVSDGLSCPETITRTWTYTDACGNTATETQIITVNDTQAPVFAAAPANATYECIGDVPAMAGLAWTDNCDGAGTDAGTEVSDGLTCPETITRTWTYTDACGNTATETQIITVHDTQAPVLAAAPANATYECIGDVPAMAGLGWTDNCDGTGTVAGSEVSDGLTCPETITRTWTYTDACGNTATETQTITVHDTQAPVFAAPPANVTVECAGDVPAMTDLGWTDNCDGAGTVTGNDVSDGLSCPETITRTWTYTDACGNNATVSQTIIVDDTTPPTASNPTTTTITAGTPIPPVDPLVVNDEADNCTTNPVVTFVSESSDNNPCPETITRIYEITDDCGNTTQVTHLVVITDPVMPTGTAPGPINVECIGDVPAADPLLITDEADNNGTPVVAYVGDVSDGLSCPETITRTYSITDVCGNQITVDQIITVQDVTAPVMAAAPADVTVECIGDVPAMIDLGWTDNCDGAGTVTGNDVSDGLSCPETITRTWTYTDACGNTSSTSQTITVIDTQAPVFDAPPADITIDCTSGLLAGNVLTWNDNCDGTGAVLPTDGPLVGGTCGGTITRTWTYTDACGNTATTTQTITVNDTQAPVLAAAPANVNVECIGDVPAMIDLGWTDNCDGAGTVTGNDVSDGLSCPETIIRTWTYTDGCGNTATVSQTIVVNDVTPPTASNPAPISVPGANDVPNPDPTVVTNEADNCTANPVVAWVSDVSDGNVCNGEIIARTYSITDDCGNQTLVTQEITILATPAPIDAGNDVTICLGENVTITVTNPWNVPIVWAPVVPQGPFAPTQTTTYTVTADNEGCISTDQVTVTVEEPPVVSFVGDVLSGCAPLTVTFTNTSTSVSGFSDCEWTINGQTLTGCNTTSYTFMNGGTYDVTLTTTSNTGCTASETYAQYIYVEDVPNADFTASQTELSSQFTEVNFVNNSTGATSYEWNFGEPGALSNEENPSHTYPQQAPASYEVTLVALTNLGCSDTARAVINVSEELIFWVPNSFTPDGDDYNDLFLPVFTEGYDPFDYHLLIFNRWGEIIWESYDASVGWDGSYGQFANEVQDGTYTWKIEFKTTMNDERIMVTGHVNLIR